ncbi:MAG: phosphoribosylformylglycinamidine synthase subunit PurS [candidate division Zixibacteria bacterium]|nr:phosphoribosylformylglycinamidine synthase subunit PurS [candidate division Zixibacteria bacterium]
MPGPKRKSNQPPTPRPQKAEIFVSLKEGVLDPQGQTIKRALADLGFEGIEEVRSGRFFQITFTQVSGQKAKQYASQISNKLLANPVIEKFEVKLLK